MEAFLEEEADLRSRKNLNIFCRDGGEGIPGKGSRRSKGPETATREMCSGIIRELLLGPNDGKGAGEVGLSARLRQLGL